VNWIVVNREDVPEGHTILSAIWAMRRKCDIAIREVNKWKARLNIHGDKQVNGLNYWNTYAPVASWAAIRIVMVIATLTERVSASYSRDGSLHGDYNRCWDILCT
jgi:Reverse transcriptase (RNA-dependent DNA polymerase)